MKLSITVDTSGAAKQMDISAKRDGKTRVLKCIYEIKNGTLRLAESATERPSSFKTGTATRTMVTTYVKKGKAPPAKVKVLEPDDKPKS